MDGISGFLAGLQAGMLGICWMLVWLGLNSVWQERSFWTAENQMASAFYGDAAIRSGFSGPTLSGLALYLLIYSMLGAMFGMAVRDRFSQLRTLIVGVLFAVAWYYVSYRFLWKSAVPLLALLHAERPTILGHMIYGAFLGRFPAYVGGRPSDVEAPAETEAGAEVGSRGTEPT